MTPERDPDILRIAQRVFTVRDSSTPRDAEEDEAPIAVRQRKRRLPHEALIFDTETRTTMGQPLMFLVSRLYIDPPDGMPGTTLIEECIVHAESLEHDDPAGFATLRKYAAAATPAVRPAYRPTGTTGVPLNSLSWWLEERLFRYGYRHRDRCDIVGFNLPFDLARIADYWASAEGDYRGGWTFGIWGHLTANDEWIPERFRPRLLIKALDPRRARMGWGSVSNTERRLGYGRFVDLRTLTFALTDKSVGLEGACKLFGIKYDKQHPAHGVISDAHIAYAREDVAKTAELYAACHAELRQHPGIRLEAHRLYSPATVGAAYLQAIGVAPPFVKHAALTPAQLGKLPNKKTYGKGRNDRA
jgi:hypothetical protein